MIQTIHEVPVFPRSPIVLVEILDENPTHATARLVSWLGGRLCLASPQELPQGALVQVAAGHRLLLGEVDRVARTESGDYFVEVGVEHVLDTSLCARRQPPVPVLA